MADRMTDEKVTEMLLDKCADAHKALLKKEVEQTRNELAEETERNALAKETEQARSALAKARRRFRFYAQWWAYIEKRKAEAAKKQRPSKEQG